FIISSSMAILKGEDQQGPSIPMKDGNYDFQALSEKLYEIKTKAQDKYLDTNRIIIQAEPEIPYQTLVSTMDASRTIIKDDQAITLFPEVSLAAGVL
ncbi:MAG: biopolymer transporter ExbD, partial [candidate division KSB1 bacterium]|nr:biopolymer transporter ExbD [candidate division KSB1 bacterium]